MINIDTRLLKTINSDQLYLLCQIVNFMNENKMCFPSNKKLCIESGFSESKMLRVKNELVVKKLISIKQRFREDGSQASNIYRIESQLIGVYITGKTMSEMTPPTFTDGEGGIFTDEGGRPSKLKTLEVLVKGSINNKEVLNSSQSTIDVPEPIIKNSFTRQSIADNLNHDIKEKEKSSAKKEKEPSDTYAAFSTFCATYERLAGVTYPTNDIDSYIMSAKDGANTKKLVTWLKSVSKNDTTVENMMMQFITAAWQIADKWQKANFTVSMIYSQCNNIYTKYLYNNPLSKDMRRQAEIDRLVNEFIP